MLRRCRCLITALCGLLLVTPASAQDADAVEAGIGLLQRTVTPQRDGRHLPRLAALRQLEDPTLRPLFERLIDHEEWQIQVHAALGLAALASPPAANPMLVNRLDAKAQEALIAHSIDEGWLEVADLRALLAMDSLAIMPRMLLLGELMLSGEEIEPDLIPPPGHDDLRIDAMAACLAAWRWDATRLVTFTNRLTGLSREIRNQNLLLLLEMLRQYHVESSTDWIAALFEHSDLHREIAARAVLALLQIDVARGLTMWRAQLGDAPSQRVRVRSGLLLLGSNSIVPAADFDRLVNGDELVEALVELGRAFAVGIVDADSFITLLDLEHRRSTEWALLALEDQPAEVATGVYLYLLDRLDAQRNAPAQHIAIAVRAAAALMDLSPRIILDRLALAEDDSILQQAILLGLFESDDPAVGQVVADIRRIGMARPDALALVLLARHAPSLNPADLQSLGVLASGGSRLSDSLRTQSAWLYLRHADRIDFALTRVFSVATPGAP